ncbi:hypothetical protein OA57_11675 [Chelonobacter oris]|uniref:Immunity protein 42 n=1 Tax=Chelonobacter oris TaxID=505317 RepID=A0A0A3B745_9PAST|nr:Imm42 family immunity protein [Chelonobacter oris]KGQ69429.1 hypothetical protein OA57_11675 [Chelonobacter oris]
MILGDDEFINKDFLIQFDIIDNNGFFYYGVFNLIIQEKIYPAYGTNWTLNLISEYMSGLLKFNDSDFYYSLCDDLSADFLFKEAVTSRLGYFYDNPEDIYSHEQMKKKYPNIIGVELELSELNDTGLEIYLFKGKISDYIVFSYDNRVYKYKTDINSIKRLIKKLYDIINIKAN